MTEPSVVCLADPRDFNRGRSEHSPVRACLVLQQFHNILSTMKVVRIAKLKLTCSPEQATQLQRVTSAYRDAQNHCSRWAFDNGRTSSGSAIQKACYQEIRTRFGLASQLACSVRDSVAATYKGLWTTTKQAAERPKVAVGRKAAGSWKGRLPRPYKGLDSAPVFKALTLEYQYGRDYSFKKAGHVSVMTLQGRMTLGYEGWKEHVLALQDPGTEVGSAKLWYDRARKQWYLLAAFTVDLPDRLSTDYRQVVGVDVGQRYHAVTKVVDLTGQPEQVQMFEGQTHRKKADQYVFIRNKLQAKGTRSALRRLVLLSGRERRFTANRNHVLAKQILAAHPHAIIAMEELAHIRERIGRGSSKKASVKMRRANQVRSTWSFAALRAMVTYKAPLHGSIVTVVDPKFTSQQCPKCGHTGRENRPGGGEVFCCVACSFTGHADVVGATNIGMKAYTARMDSGCLSAIPSTEGAVDVTHGDAEAAFTGRVEAECSHKPVTSVICDLTKGQGEMPEMDSVVPRCPYPSVRRSNPTFGALGTMFRQQGASILLWTRGSLGRMSESEPSSVRLVK